MLKGASGREPSGRRLSLGGDGREAPLIVDTDRPTALFLPLGVPVLTAADGLEPLLAMAEAFRGWEGEADPAAPALRLDVVCDRSLSGTGDVEIEAEGSRLQLHGGGAHGWADAASGRAQFRASAAYFEEVQRLRADVVDPLALFLLARSGRVPVHAAGFLAGDLAVLLAGPSGAGKSCLALAARAAGYPLLSDDIVHVQLQPLLRLWGVPAPVHVFLDDAPPGTSGPVRLRNGKLKRAVEEPPPCSAPSASRAVLCVLKRGAEPSLVPLSPDQALSQLERLEPGFDLIAEEVGSARAALSRNGAWLLTLSSDPAAAVHLLAQSLPELQSRAVP